MTKAKEFYTVMELSDELGVKRTTINDWLSKYSIYIESQVIGKRRTYTKNTVAVLKKISDLRTKGLPAFEIEATLSKLFPIHPSPEPSVENGVQEDADSVVDAENAGEKVTETKKNDGNEVPELKPVSQSESSANAMLPAVNTAELLAKLQQMLDKVAQMEQVSAQVSQLTEQLKSLPMQIQAQSTPSEPVVVPPPVVVEGHTKLRIVVNAVLLLLILAVLCGAGCFVYREYRALKGEIVSRDSQIIAQQRRNEEISQQVQQLNRQNSTMEMKIGNLSNELKSEKAEFEKRDKLAQEQLRTEKEFRQRESADKERLQQEKTALEADVKKSNADRVTAEKAALVAKEKAAAAEKNAADAQKKSLEAERKLQDLQRKIAQPEVKQQEMKPNEKQKVQNNQKK